MLHLCAFLAVFCPLIGAITVGLCARQLSDRWSFFLTLLPMGIACCAGLFVCYHTCILGETARYVVCNFLTIKHLNLHWSLSLDALSGMMIGIVTLVSFLVHMYSVGYMHGESGVPRFMAYLSLFTFFMLMLVTASHLVQMFFGWEGVGLASYLLIGFYYRKESACDAAMKAFLVNRVGDVFFVAGIAFCLWGFGSIEFSHIIESLNQPHIAQLSLPGIGCLSFLEVVGLCFFVGAMGKSAQIGLHVWLPDAMEGPTPVSALIHAATMVTAGIFLMARLSPLLELIPFVRMLIVVVGGLTALMAATIACVQMDVKRVIAYSTCSQLGYMFMGIGAGAYGAAVFHLATHAFFKALLFLGAGSLIHSFSGSQDMSEMGGVWKKLPFTYIAMWVGNLALAGIPFFSGFYSKDAILGNLGAQHVSFCQFGFAVGLLGVVLTAFYSWRLLFLAFHGKNNATALVQARIHESPWVMRMPLIVLGLGAIFAGFFLQPLFLSETSMWVKGALVLPVKMHNPLWKEVLPIIFSLAGIGIAFYLYVSQKALPQKIATTFSALYSFLKQRWYIDRLYDVLFVQGIIALSGHLWRFIDMRVIDAKGVHGPVRVICFFGNFVRFSQTGFLQHYITWICVGMLAFCLLMIRGT